MIMVFGVMGNIGLLFVDVFLDKGVKVCVVISVLVKIEFLWVKGCEVVIVDFNDFVVLKWVCEDVEKIYLVMLVYLVMC